MYSGSGLKPLKVFDAWFGAHQRLNRLARRQLAYMVGDNLTREFPSSKEIMQFEGFDGPDGIKMKTPAQGEPWHYYNPFDIDDTQIIDLLEGNYHNLVSALKTGDMTRAAFEAAWLAHGIVDGLTPAHHYPYEEELIRLRGGQGIETRTTPKDKVLMPGDTMREKLRNNWGMWGDKGLLSTHMAFEIGVAVLIVPMRYRRRLPTASQIDTARTKNGFVTLFREAAQEIAELELYQRFYTAGWTPKLAGAVRRSLVPRTVDVIMLTWYSALKEAKK